MSQYTMAYVKKRCEEGGILWFSPEYIRSFRSIIGSFCYAGKGGAYFVSSEQLNTPQDEVMPRRSTVRQFIDVKGRPKILTVGSFYEIVDNKFANATAKELSTLSLQKQLDRAIRMLDLEVAELRREHASRIKYGSIEYILENMHIKLSNRRTLKVFPKKNEFGVELQLGINEPSTYYLQEEICRVLYTAQHPLQGV